MAIVIQDRKWAAVIAGLRTLGLSDERIASEAGTTVDQVALMSKGLVLPEPMPGMNLRRMEVHYRRLGGVAAAPKVGPERGVYEDDVCQVGRRMFKVVLSDGQVGFIDFPERLVDPDFVANLNRRLDARDPVAKLRAI